MDNQALLQLFVESLKAQGAIQTQARYARACQSLVDEVGDSALATLSRHDLQRCLAKLHARGLSPRTLAVTLSAWKAWFRYLSKSLDGFDDKLSGIKAPRAAKRLPNALSETDAVRLVETDQATSEDSTPESHRNQAMFEILYGCGIRVGELVGLNLADVDIANHEIRVFGKGRKERIVPLGEPAIDALEHWLHARKQWAVDIDKSPNETALFLGARGARITPQVVRLVLKQRAIERGLDTHVYPHRLRHSFASHVLQSSQDLRAVQELMGHASIASTQVYTHLDFQHLARVYDQAHPRARKKVK